jgi:large subunit ribosomal protein L9
VIYRGWVIFPTKTDEDTLDCRQGLMQFGNRSTIIECLGYKTIEIVMSKRVQVVLTQDISKLGRNGDLVEVAPGYARNYLFPQSKAVRATPGILKQVERRREEERQRQIEIKQQAESRKTALETIGRFTIAKQVGENEAIFGTVTDRELAEAIQTATNQEVDRRGITLPDISKTGFYKAQIKLHPEVTAEVEVHVVPS